MKELSTSDPVRHVAPIDTEEIPTTMALTTAKHVRYEVLNESHEQNKPRVRIEGPHAVAKPSRLP